MQNVAEKIYQNRICAFLRALTEHDAYPAVIGAFALCCYLLGLPLLAISVFATLFTFTFFCSKDTRPAMTLVLLVFLTLCYKQKVDAYKTVAAFVIYGVFGALVLASIVFHLIVYPTPKQNHRLLIGFALFSVGMLIGGVFSDHYRAFNFVNALSVSAVLFGGYLLFSFTMFDRKDNLLYVARIAAVAVCVIAVELLQFYVREYHFGTTLNGTWKSQIILGWGISNFVGEMIAMLLPAVFYLIYKEKYGYFYYLVAIVGLVAIYFTLSRNAMLFGGLSFVVGMTASAVLKRHWLNWILLGGIVLAGGVAVWLIYHYENVFTMLGLKDNGRFALWRRYIDLFKESPIFGVGVVAYRNLYPGANLNAHNTLLHMLSGSGIIGLALYLAHRLQTVLLFLKKPNLDRLFVGSCVVVGVGMSLLSPLFFRLYFLVYYSVFLMLLEKSVEADKTSETLSKDEQTEAKAE